jgi:hypothetical protein
MHTSPRIVVTLSNHKFTLLIRILKYCDCASCKSEIIAQTTTHFLTYDRTQSRTALSAEVLSHIRSLVRSLHSSHKRNAQTTTHFLTYDRRQSRTALSAEVLSHIRSLVRSLHSSHKINAQTATHFLTYDRTQSRTALSAEVLFHIRSLVRSLHSSHKIHQLLVTMFVSLFLTRQPLQWSKVSSFTWFLDHTHTHKTTHQSRQDSSGRVISTLRKDLYLTTHNNHNRQTSMPQLGFELTISAGERPETYSLDRAATGTGLVRM